MSKENKFYPRFYLVKHPYGSSTIEISVNFRGDRFLFGAVGISVEQRDVKGRPVEYWNKKEQRFYTTSKLAAKHGGKVHESFLEYNTRLKNIGQDIQRYFEGLKYNKTAITFEEVKTYIRNQIILGGYEPKEEKAKTIYPYFEQFIKDTESGLRKHIYKNQLSIVKPQTSKSYHVLLNKLKQFDSKQRLTFDEINMQFYNKFVRFLELESTDNGKIVKLGTTSIGNYIKNLKVFLQYGIEMNWHNNIIFKSKKFLTPKLQKEKSIFNIDVLKSLWNHEPTKPHLIKIKYQYLFLCFTGLRYNDFLHLDYSLFDFDDLVEFNQQKTGGKANIYLHPYLKAIQKEGIFELPRISNQKFNDQLYELFMEAGLENNTEIVNNRERREYTAHTARHIFTTLLREYWHLSESDAAFFTGHSDGGRIISHYTHKDNDQLIERINEGIKKFAKDYKFDPKFTKQIQQTIDSATELNSNAKGFIKDTIDKTGMTEKDINESMEVAKNIIPEVKDMIQKLPKKRYPVMGDLLEIARTPKDKQRQKLTDILAKKRP